MTSLKFPDGSEVLYELTRKPVKNINLRVKEDGSLRISASPRVSVKRVEEFIVSEQAFIRRAQQRIIEREEHSEIRADIFRWLGGEYPVRVISSSREAAVLEQEEMRVFTRFPERAEELLKRWTADNFVELCRKLNAEVRGSLINSGLTPPPTVITIKDMKTRWGSCNPRTKKLWFSVGLAGSRPTRARLFSRWCGMNTPTTGTATTPQGSTRSLRRISRNTAGGTPC